ncbi:MAG: DUF3180 domain-containing protein [Candidatus Nanopelagicales bacterium]
MKPTRVVPLLVLAAVGLAVGWVAVDLVDRLGGRILSVPWIASGALWLLAFGVLAWAIISRPSLVDPNDRESSRGRPATVTTTPARTTPRKRMPQLVAVRTAALALAASRTGAVIGGFYLGVALALIPVAGTATGASSIGAAIASVAACLLLVGAAVWLESMCRLRDRGDGS